MKKLFTYSRLFKSVFLTFFTLILLNIYSCKKDKGTSLTSANVNLGTTKTISPTTIAVLKLPDTLVIHPNEVSNWVKSNLSADQAKDVQYVKSLQSVIMGHHVVRVPIGNDAALFFTKRTNSLEVYSYKWQDDKLNKAKYNGLLLAMSFQSGTAKLFDYSKEKILAYDITLTGRGDPNLKLQNISLEKVKTNGDDIKTTIAKIWCWLTGGTWREHGAQGEYYMPGCDYSVEPNDGGGDASSGGTNYGETPGNGITYGTPVDFGDGVKVGGVSYGGGVAWVDVSMVDASGGCGPDGTEFSDPGSGCSTSNTYNPYQVDANGAVTLDPPPDYTVRDPSYVINEDSDAQELDENNNNSGNEDNTDYGSYQDGDFWPTVTPIIPKAYFVGISQRRENCMDLCKAQIRKMGYQISDYGATGQTFQMFKAAGGQNYAVSLHAVSYVRQSIINGVPVIVGVDDKDGSSNPYTDNTTDHFIVVVGMGTDSNGKYFQFYDSSTSSPSLGANSLNKLYFNSYTGELTGSSQTPYANSAGHHPYKVTQVRKSKKI